MLKEIQTVIGGSIAGLIEFLMKHQNINNTNGFEPLTL